LSKTEAIAAPCAEEGFCILFDPISKEEDYGS